jgi:hypothetical protein
MRLHQDERGLLGKIAVIWLLVIALVGVAAVDTASIIFTKFKLSDVAVNAANAGVAAFKTSKSGRQACEAAAATVEAEDESLELREGDCKVNARDGSVTIVLRTEAKTILASRLPFTEDFGKIVMKETVGATAL